ncbi:Crp/Fnr family transcriptional regulator [Hamadaea tsunoensis]|uniref:Crp/Fnr family transcriptional regulator n=1 Tax=Hamadaea tsunoensis TaxID=53368 RepID=UPI00054DE32D|nr:Crp/Fnr family transcriptional regulator [Hamadaea tsunoensis]
MVGISQASRFWPSLSEKDRGELLALGQRRMFSVESVIIEQDAPPGLVFVILSGCVKVVALDKSGYQAILALRQAGDVVGEMASLDGGTRSASVLVLSEVRALTFRSEVFSTFIRAHREAAAVLQRCLAERLREADRHRAAAATYSTTQRLARILIDLSRNHGSPQADGSVLIGLPLSQDDLAGLLSVSRRTVARIMEDWRSGDIVATGRLAIHIKDQGRLLAIAA